MKAAAVPLTQSPLSFLLYTVLNAKRYWWATALLWLFLVLPAQALELRIAVKHGIGDVDLGTSTPGIVRDSRGQALYQLPQLQRITIDEEAGQLDITDGRTDYATDRAFWLEPSGDGVVWIGDRWYRGRVLVVPSEDGLTAINYVDLEKYLYSVVGSEMPASWPQAALQAQAVAARSYALYQQSRAAGRDYDLGGTQAWQVYRGLSGEATSTIAAVEATAGQVLTYSGRVIEAVFHSSSGGHTENSEDVWTSAVPYLKGVEDFDQDAPVFSWQVSFAAADISRHFGSVGLVQDIQVVDRSGHGRVKSVRITGNRGSTVVKGTELRNVLGLRSTKFNISVNRSSQTFQITGHGFGHGIGLSQWGARGMALQGRSYNDILSHYYQSTSLGRL